MSISYNSGSTPNPYGQIQRAGMLPNGRAVYRVVDGQGQETGRVTIPQQNIGQFEKAYRDIMESAPKLQQYQIEMSDPKNVKKKRILTMALCGSIIALCGGVGYEFTRKKATWKKVLGTGGGIVAGVAAALGASVAMALPPGMNKFNKATKTLSQIDIQPLNISA